MTFLGNIIWLILGGIVIALIYYIVGLLMCITIIGIPFGNSGCDSILEKDISPYFGSSGLTCAKGTLHFAAVDCFTEQSLNIGTSSSPQQTLEFDGYDQHFKTVKAYKGDASNESKTANKIYNSSAPATMTVSHNFSHKGDLTAQGWGRFRGHLSFAFDSDGKSGAYCGINTYGTNANDTDGSITALNGTIHLGDNMQFTKLSALVVTNTGSIALATGRFNDTCDVYLSGDGKLILSNGVTLAVNRVFYKDDQEVRRELIRKSYYKPYAEQVRIYQ